ncbi:hypothetical protein Tco_0297579, partial [Tanacetum coccineum]
ELEVIDKQLVELLVEQLRFDDSFETEMYVMVDNEMSIVDWVELIHIVMVKTVVEVKDYCKKTDKC